jgi:hypothetical protein
LADRPVRNGVAALYDELDRVGGRGARANGPKHRGGDERVLVLNDRAVERAARVAVGDERELRDVARRILGGIGVRGGVIGTTTFVSGVWA